MKVLDLINSDQEIYFEISNQVNEIFTFVFKIMVVDHGGRFYQVDCTSFIFLALAPMPFVESNWHMKRAGLSQTYTVYYTTRVLYAASIASK